MKAFRVSGTSMWPALKDGDLVIAKEAPAYKFASLLVRESEGIIVLHRWLSEQLTKGDRFATADPPMAGFESAFEVTHVVPKFFADRAGEMRGCDLRESKFRQRLEGLQGKISARQLALKSKVAKRLATLALIVNGQLIRSCYFAASLQGRSDVMSDFE